MEINTRMKKYHHYLTLLSLFMLLGILKLQAAIQLPCHIFQPYGATT